jgi:exonuclease SbcD
VRILFLSDTHLGLDLPARPRVARRRRGEDFFRNLALALAPALAGEADAVVHGGDLHFRSRVPAWLAEAAIAPLRRVADRGVPVLLVPGNHERSRLPFPLLARHERLHVFDVPRSFVLEARGLRVAFAGFPYAPDVRARFPSLLETARRGAPAADLRVLCLHQCVEGATCGPGTFTFRDGPDVIRRADLPADAAVVLCGHVHRHQVLRGPGRPPVVYAGSVERTSFAELGEPKGAVLVELAASGVASIAFRPLPARPMAILPLRLAGLGPAAARDALERALRATPEDAVVQLRVDGPVTGDTAPLLGAAWLRAVGGARNVSVRWPRSSPLPA